MEQCCGWHAAWDNLTLTVGEFTRWGCVYIPVDVAEDRVVNLRVMRFQPTDPFRKGVHMSRGTLCPVKAMMEDWSTLLLECQRSSLQIRSQSHFCKGRLTEPA